MKASDLFQGQALGPPTPEVIERFNEKMTPEPMSGCFLWHGCHGAGGYGSFWYDGKVRKAHRVALAIEFGSLEPGLDVMHTCDNPACVNPRHLRAAPTAVNIRDSFAKGRSHRRGNKNPRTKITDEMLPIAERLAECGVEPQQIAYGFDVDYSTIRRVLRKERGVA